MSAAPSPEAFEKLGVFYLGREVRERDKEAATDAPFLYPSRDLLTHAVVIGMTGSGKTGLSIAMLEEAAIDGVPAIVLDPKGDLGNLALTFPSLRAEEFAPWVPHGESAETEATKWREGLAAWGEDGARIQRLRDAAEIALYTPGSRAGRPLSILGSLAAPSPAEREDADLVGERISQVATSLLGLVGVTVEAGRSREHVLVSQILKSSWAAGEDLDLAALVRRIQAPSFTRIGVLDLEQFFPEKERFDLAIAYNGILASPTFEAWLVGEPLDIASLLHTKEGKPKISVLTIAHLGDAERMFFVSLLLGQLVSWMRTQPGTPSLRALFFMDEVAGYFPPVAMPPSKPPLMTLLKQARAFGLGIVLATQNPVDLDYKGLSNAGSWFIGRLQTERDKARVLDGLEGAQLGSGFDRASVDVRLSSLAKRHFYVHDVHAERPTVIESRWTMSYLRGPLTRDEMKRLTISLSPRTPAANASASATGSSASSTQPIGTPARAAAESSAPSTTVRPVVPRGITELFFPTTEDEPSLRPCVLGAARVTFSDAKTKLEFAREVLFALDTVERPLGLRWEDSRWAGNVALAELLAEPPAGARFAAPEAAMLVAKSYPAWEKKLSQWLATTQGITRWKSVALKQFSEPGEDLRAFRARLAQASREARDQATQELRASYGPKLAALEERIRRAQAAVQKEEAQAAAEQRNAAFVAGGGLLSAFLGGTARGAVASATRAAKSAGRVKKERGDVAREKENVDALVARYRELDAELRAALAGVASELDPASAPLEQVVTKTKKTGVAIHTVALAWRA